jgi:hypothetical protein
MQSKEKKLRIIKMKVLILYNEGMRAYCIEYVKSLCINSEIECMNINATTILPSLNYKILLTNWFHIDEYETMLNLNIQHHNASCDDLDIGIINLEQLSRQDMIHGLLNIYRRLIQTYKNLKLYDYIQGNIEVLKQYDLSSKLLEYQYNDEEVELLKNFNNQPKEYDVMMVGCMSSGHRMNIFNALKQRNINAKYFTNLWADARDAEIGKAKILLNIHYTPNYAFFESLRCARWIFSNKCIITETSLNCEDYYLNKYMMTVPYDNIIDKVIETLSAEDNYKINFSEAEIAAQKESLFRALDM